MPCSAVCRRWASAPRLRPRSAEVRLSELAKVWPVTWWILKRSRQRTWIPRTALRARIVASGEFAKAVTIKGVHLTKGARQQSKRLAASSKRRPRRIVHP